MKTTVENLDPSRIKLTVEVPYEELKTSLDAAYKEIGSQIQVPGFRRGHVPNRVIDQRVGRGTVIQEAVNNKLSDFYRDAITEAERVPMLQPEVDVVELPNAAGENGGQLAFTAEVTVRPVIELPDLSKAKLTVDAVEVTDEDVDTELDNLRARFGSLKSVGRKAARRLGKSYEEARLIVCHLGGGVSVAAHDHGRVVDVFNVKDEGAMGMDRGGGLPVNQLIGYCYAGRSREEVKRTLGRRSGMLSYVGTTDFREICAGVVSGDERFTAAYRALVYQLAKDIGAMAAVLHFEVDAIVYTGGMAYEQFFCDDITAYVGRLAPVLRFPGEEEMRALAEGALRVLHGEAQAERY